MKFNQIFSVLFAAAMCVVLVFAIVFMNNKIANEKDKISIGGNDVITGSVDEIPDDVQNIDAEDEDTDESIPPEPEIKIVSFLAAGDNIVHQSVMDDAKKLAQGTNNDYNFSPMYENIKNIVSDADIAFINQEGPIAGKSLSGYTGYPNFNAPDEAGKALVETGFDIVNIANNHLLDRGEKGYENSISFWEAQPVMLVGGHRSEQDFNTIRYYEYGDLTIAFLSYTYGTNGIYLPADSTMWVPYYDKETVDRHSKIARENADIVIASMHWGVENAFTPNNIQKEYCDILVNNNVDVIIGTHPHVLQPIEWKTRPDGKKTLVAYSIGNLLSTMEYSRNMVGGLLTFDIIYTHPSDAVISNPKLIPTFCYYTKSRDGLKIYEFSEFTKDMYLTHGCTLKENVSYEKAVQFVTGTIDSEFLPEEFLSFINS